MKPIFHQPTPEEKKELEAYCERDVLLSVQLARELPVRIEPVRALWELSTRINARGIGIDTPFAKAAVQCAQQAKETANEALPALTHEQIHSVTQTVALKAWINANSDLALPNVAQATLEAVDLGEVPVHVAAVIRARLEGRAAAVGKFKAALNGTSKRSRRFRGAFLAYGAPTTGRFTSRRLQVHNMRRDVDADALPALRRRVVNGNWQNVSLNDLARNVRGMIIPAKGHVLLKADWAQIEARVAPWLAADLDITAAEILAAFEFGDDIYKHQAAKMFGVLYENVDKQHRFMGKVAQLSLGYQGGWNALNRMAVANGAPAFREQEARNLVLRWREQNRWAVLAWSALERAAISAVANTGTTHRACRCHYIMSEDRRFLLCYLPSGRALAYPFPRLELNRYDEPQVTYKKATRMPKATETEWPRTALYGGLQLENVTQAVAADILMQALAQCERLELPVVSHVHDEIVLEVPERDADAAAAALLAIMREAAKLWGKGLPLDAEVSILERYR